MNISKKEQKSLTVLMLAVLENDFNLVIDNVMEFAGQFSSTYKTALHYAIILERTTIAEFLVHYEAKCMHEHGKSALMWAMDCKNLQIAALLTSELRMFNFQNKSALYYALKHEFPEQIKYSSFYKELLQNECHQIFQPGYYTALGQVIQYQIDLCEPLLDQLIQLEGLRVSAQTQELMPLAHAALTNNSKIVDKLLATFRVDQLISHYPLHALAKHNLNFQFDKLKPFLRRQNEFEETALMVACRFHSTDTMKLLMAETGMRTGVGKTALMIAAHNKFSEGVNALFDAEKHLWDRQGLSALSYAAQTTQDPKTKRELRTKLDQKSLYKLIFYYVQKDTNAMRVVIEENNEELFNLMKMQTSRNYIHEALQYNMQDAVRHYQFQDPILNQNGDSVLQTCIKNQQSKFYDTFKHQIGHQNQKGETALIFAVMYLSEFDILPKFLLQESEICDYQGHTALFYAIKLGKRDLVRMLLQKEAKCVNQWGQMVIGWLEDQLLDELFTQAEIREMKAADYFGRRSKRDYTDCFGRSSKLIRKMCNQPFWREK